MKYPRPDIYLGVIQTPRVALIDPELQAGAVKTNPLGIPRFMSGNFAVTYTLSSGARTYAVRCFHKRADALEQRYQAISEKLRQLASPYFVPFEFQEQGIRVSGQAYPIVKMDWASGTTMGDFVATHYRSRNHLAALRNSLKELGLYLEQQQIAHGDIQPANLMVDREGQAIQLIDYDGMYVPAIGRLGASEMGVANFQHPKRDMSHFDVTLDRFSLISITLALKALEENPGLWDITSDTDRFLFSKADFDDPALSDIFLRLFGMRPDIATDARALAAICLGNFLQIPSFSDFLAGRNIPQIPVVPKSQPAQQPSHPYTPPLQQPPQTSPSSQLQAANQKAIHALNMDQLFQRGLAFEHAQNYPQAFECFLDAAKQGYAMAQYKAGWCYILGQGVDVHNYIAVGWLRKAAVQDYAEAQYDLGCMYDFGLGVQQDKTQAKVWYDRAAAQGIQETTLIKTHFLVEVGGTNVPDESPMPKGCIVAAAIVACFFGLFVLISSLRPSYQGHSLSGGNYQPRPATPAPVQKQIDHFAQAMQFYNNKQYKEAFPHMLQAAGQGNHEAQNYAGWMYAKGRGTERNDGNAVFWYQQSANQGNQHAQLNLGRMYDQGLGVQKDPVSARIWYQKSAEQGNQYAQLYLGDLLAASLNYAHAIVYYQQAANQDNAVAQFNMGDMYENGKGVNRDLDTAGYWYRKAANQGIKKAKEALSRIETSRSYQGYSQPSSGHQPQQATRQSVQTMVNIATQLIKENQFEAAFPYMLVAAEQGHSTAQMAVGVMYYRGRGTVENYYLGIFWLKKAAAQGETEAKKILNSIGIYYYQ